MKRIPQPPVQPALRPTEAHGFWPGFVALVFGCVLTLAGARHMTSIETVDGATALHTQLIKAFSSGGLRYASQVSTPPPKVDDADPGATAEAWERWQRKQAVSSSPGWKVRVDTGAHDPCPT